MRAKLDDLNSIHTLVQLNISERLHSSNKKLSFQITWRIFFFYSFNLSKTLKKSLQTSSETNFPLTQAFKWSKNKFGEFTYPKG